MVQLRDQRVERPGEKGRRRVVVWVAVVLFIFSIAYLVISLIAVNQTVREYAVLASDEPVGAVSDTISYCSIPGFTELNRQRAFLAAQLEMAATDSIGLLISVPDSTIRLMIKGVPVRTMKIAGYDIPALLRHADQELLHRTFSTPLTITGMRATFRKDPVRVMVAPRDTSEAAPDIKPATSRFAALFFTLSTDRNLRITFEQHERTGLRVRCARFFFILGERVRDLPPVAAALAGLKMPQYIPTIKIYLPGDEVKVIYRAIPREGEIALTL